MSDYHPLVSIVIPVYNGANYMREAIDSALAQTYDNCEVIVVNDGSSDNGETERIALSYGGKIRYCGKENGGVATALNLGIREMRGEYFSWLSHDDVYLPEKVAKQIRFIEELELYETVLYSSYSTIDGSGRYIEDVVLPGVSPDSFFQFLYLRGNVHGCTLLIPRLAFERAGTFSEELITTQDYDLWVRMCSHFPFVYQHELLLQSRQHEQQGSRTISVHYNESADFHAKYLPQLVSTITAHKTSAEAFRQKKELIAQLCGGARRSLARAVYAMEEDKNEFTKLRTAYRKAALQAVAKNLIRPFWRCLPAGAKPWIRSLRNRFFGVHAGSSAPRRLDFDRFYRENGFGAAESLSGGGSSLFQTRIIRRELPVLLHTLQVESFLDIPCGDFNWMQHVAMEGTTYIGGDIVYDIVTRNQERYATNARVFLLLDAVNGPLPHTSLIFCRDCLVYLPFEDALNVLRTFKKSGTQWLLTTHFPACKENIDLIGIPWRPLNLMLPPFDLPEPVTVIDEKCSEDGGIYKDKCLALWDLHKLDLFSPSK